MPYLIARWIRLFDEDEQQPPLPPRPTPSTPSRPTTSSSLPSTPYKMSPVISLLPQVLQSRLERLTVPVTGFSSRASVSEPSSPTSVTPPALDDSGYATPVFLPGGKHIRAASTASSETVVDPLSSALSVPARVAEFELLGGVLDSCDRAMVRESVVGRTETEDVSGLDWKSVRQGMRKISLAAEEHKLPTSQSDSTFERQEYLGGLIYLLHALPQSLSPHEQAALRSALPPSLTDPQSQALFAGQTFPFGARRTTKRSLLHRSVQSLVVNIVVLFSVLLPYIVLLARFAARAERRYRVSETLMAQSMCFAREIGKRGVRVGGVVCGMSDGVFGRLVSDSIAWAVEGLAGGVTDGVGEGLALVQDGGRFGRN